MSHPEQPSIGRAGSPLSDLDVDHISNALHSKKIDVIVSGSIGAVESVRFVRSLRRLGASVNVWLTKGGAQFITPMALEWASNNTVQTDFEGKVSHLATGDACIVAPASANFIRKLAQGITDSPASALAASYGGLKRPVIIVPNMHDSLFNAPQIAENLERVRRWVHVLETRNEEGKRKFPEPQVAANACAHLINQTACTNKRVLVAFGSTKAYLDDVRYLSNYSSGALGSLICEELYRRGFVVEAVSGSAMIQPSNFSRLHKIETNAELSAAAQKVLADGATAAVFLPSVLDYIPDHKQDGKLRSGKESLNITLVPTEKIIAKLNPTSKIKVGFKLETEISPSASSELAKSYLDRYGLSLLVLNKLSDVSAAHHTAVLFYREAKSANVREVKIEGKRTIAHAICDHVDAGLREMGQNS